MAIVAGCAGKSLTISSPPQRYFAFNNAFDNAWPLYNFFRRFFLDFGFIFAFESFSYK